MNLAMIFLSKICLILSFLINSEPAEFRSYWSPNIERIWAGSEYWTNPLQDWRVSKGRLECYRSGGDRNTYILTRELNAQRGNFEMSVRMGQLEPENRNLSEGWVGFRIGSRGEFNDYRDSAVRGDGLDIGLGTDGLLYIGGFPASSRTVKAPFNDLTLKIKAEPNGGHYKLSIIVYDNDGSILSEAVRDDVHPNWLTGNIALICSAGKTQIKDISRARSDYNRARPGQQNKGNVLFWFRDWQISGNKIEVFNDRALGPILFAQYTLSRNVMKMTAQMAPVGNGSRVVRLQIKKRGRPGWETIAESLIDPLSRTAAFRVSDWDDTHKTPYRLAYTLSSSKNTISEQFFKGTIAKNPINKEKITVGGLCCKGDMGFPHLDVVRNLKAHKPDILFFMGDQIYESVGAYGVKRIKDVKIASLDYLRKWYMFGLTFRDLLRVVPSICMPDDHDVYQGNVWGAGGRAATRESDFDESGSFARNSQKAQDRGGFTMPAVWVNMVQRTQSSHLPDPYDATPAEQGITVYYCDIRYGGISFAVLEDRKFKSAPQVQLPKARIINGWAQNPEFDAAQGSDVPGAVLLGERQLNFLDDWSADWSSGVWMKAAVSQTLFTNLATLPEPANTDAVTPGLKVAQPGEYVEGDILVQDHDSNGWPQTGRNKAIDRMRKCFAVHIVGDQHLGSTVQYGIDGWHDANYCICVPAIANIWPRRWFPNPELGKNKQPNAPAYTGDYNDGFGNKVSVYAIANPRNFDVEPKWITQRSPGYGIITFNRKTRDITLANWPRWVDPTGPGAKPYNGWPVTINQMDNYGRKAVGFLPTIEVEGMSDPVVQIIDEPDGEIVYTMRIKGTSFKPKVFKTGYYTVKIGEPGTAKFKVLEHVKSYPEHEKKSIKVIF